MDPKLKARFGSENIQDRNLSGMNHRDSGIARKIARDYGSERSMNHPDSGIARVETTGSDGKIYDQNIRDRTAYHLDSGISRKIGRDYGIERPWCTRNSSGNHEHFPLVVL